MDKGGKMSFSKTEYTEFCEWALKKDKDLNDKDLSKSFTQRDNLYMRYLADILKPNHSLKEGGKA